MPNSLREAGLDINKTDLISVGRKKTPKNRHETYEKAQSQCHGPKGFGVQVSFRQCSYISWWPVVKHHSWLRKYVTTGNKKWPRGSPDSMELQYGFVQPSKTTQSLTPLLRSIRINARHLTLKKSLHCTFTRLADSFCNLCLQN